MDTLIFLAPPLVACLLLVAILGYFGNHILIRGVIFVDIAVAQVAALGTMLGIWLGGQEGSLTVSLFSLGFTLSIVALFAMLKSEHEEISKEVIIGVIYCMALALAYLLVDRVSGGSNFIQKTFTGAILWVTWTDIIRLLIIISPVLALHVWLSKSLIKMTTGKHDQMPRTTFLALELFFYITFGIIVVEAVKIGGIFVVFMFLIAPAAMASFLTETWKGRFLYSGLLGAVGTLLGLIISYRYNLPNGPTLVCTLGLMLFVISLTTRQTGSLVIQRRS